MEEVRRLRQAKGWNQNELAFHADLAPSVISLLETGKREPNATTLRKLAEALEVRIPDLFEDSGSGKAHRRSSPEPSLFNGIEDERHPHLQNWTSFVHRLADRWEREIEKREEEWRNATPPIRKTVKRVPNLQWANEIVGTATDVMTAAGEELEMALGVATLDEARELFSALGRMKRVIDRTDAWYSSADGNLDTAKVVDFQKHLERMQRRIGAQAS